MSKRGQFASKFGVLMATVGSAVGLGNIWRFPYQVGDGGGGAYIFIYALAVLLIGIPAMIAEFVIGRETHSNAVTSFKKLAPGTAWSGIGYLGVFTGLVIDCYYCVVTGWTVYYLFKSISGGLLGRTVEGYTVLFNTFSAEAFWPLFFMLLVIIITGVIVSFGIKDGIEKTSKIMMPLLFLILLILAVNSCFLDGAKEGLDFLFVPDISKIQFRTVLSATGQAFYSLSLGMACLVTYASYFKDDVKLPQTALKISVMDMFVAVFAGVIIFPAVFSFGMQPEQGPGLVFKVLPNVFSQMIGGYFWSLLFYILLFLAALTSFISITEVVVAYISESFNIARVKAVIITCVMFAAVGTLCSLSFGPLKGVTIFGKSIFNFMDFLATNILLPIGGIFISLFVGWKMDRKHIEKEMASSTSSQKANVILTNILIFFLRFIVPFAVAAVLVAGLIN